MKKSFIFLFPFLLFGEAYAQDDYTQRVARNHHLELARKQNLAGFVALGLGAAAIGTGIVKQNQTPLFRNIGFEEDYNSKGKTMIVIGSIVGAASIPLFALAAKNKKKANSIEIKNQPVSFLYLNKQAVIAQPALALKIPL